MTFLMSQEPCEGTCLSEEETQGLFNNIKELVWKIIKKFSQNLQKIMII